MSIIIIPGAKPNETTSAKVSSCLPRLFEIESNRAKNPSKKSKTIAKKTSSTAKSILPAKQQITLPMPQMKFDAVIMFGKLKRECFKIFMGGDQIRNFDLNLQLIGKVHNFLKIGMLL